MGKVFLLIFQLFESAFDAFYFCLNSTDLFSLCTRMLSGEELEALKAQEAQEAMKAQEAMEHRAFQQENDFAWVHDGPSDKTNAFFCFFLQHKNVINLSVLNWSTCHLE